MGHLVRLVMLVEHDAEARRAIQALLERAGFHVTPARDGAEAWELLARGPRPVAILADLHTPRMTGRDLVARIRRTPLASPQAGARRPRAPRRLSGSPSRASSSSGPSRASARDGTASAGAAG
jgi:CheY-like chemotaxis protein